MVVSGGWQQSLWHSHQVCIGPRRLLVLVCVCVCVILGGVANMDCAYCTWALISCSSRVPWPATRIIQIILAGKPRLLVSLLCLLSRAVSHKTFLRHAIHAARAPPTNGVFMRMREGMTHRSGFVKKSDKTIWRCVEYHAFCAIATFLLPCDSVEWLLVEYCRS